MKKSIRFCSLVVAVSLLAVTLFPSQTWITYAASSKYDNTHVNTGNQAADITAIAMTQVGYCEGNSSSHLDGTVAGSKNYTKYGAWYGYQAAWCGMFVSWCANQAGISTSVVPKTGVVNSFLSFYQKADRYYKARSGYIPKAGDLILFSWSHSSSSAEHIGLVISYDSATEKVWFVDGNYSNKVNYRSLHYQNADIQSYCSPNYTNSAPNPTPTPSPVPSGEPTMTPTEKPTQTPTQKPTVKPTQTPTEKPTATQAPTQTPTQKPTATVDPSPTPTSKPVTLTGIEVSQEPDQTMYPEGAVFDKTGLVVQAVYSDGTKKAVTNYVISGFRSDTIGRKALTISYEGFKAVLFVTIVPIESSESDGMDDLEKIEGLVLPDSEEMLAYLAAKNGNVPDLLKLRAYIKGSTSGATVQQPETVPGRLPETNSVFE